MSRDCKFGEFRILKGKWYITYSRLLRERAISNRFRVYQGGCHFDPRRHVGEEKSLSPWNEISPPRPDVHRD